MPNLIRFYALRTAALASALSWTLASCQSGTQIASPQSGSSARQKPTATVSSDSTADASSVVSMAEPIDYPSYTFKGLGGMTHDSDTFKSTSSIETTISETELTVNQPSRTVDLRGKGGSDKQTGADDKIRRQSIGSTKYKRSTIEEKKALGEDNAPYVIFASGVSTVSGRKYTFSSPVPVFPIPGNENRYVDLVGTKTFKANVTCTGCPMAASFSILVTASKQVTGGTVALKLETAVEAQGISGGLGAAYHGFPLAKSATFTIDTNTSMLMGIDTVHLYLQDEAANGTASGPEERSTMQYKICTYKKGAKSETFSCP